MIEARKKGLTPNEQEITRFDALAQPESSGPMAPCHGQSRLLVGLPRDHDPVHDRQHHADHHGPTAPGPS